MDTLETAVQYAISESIASLEELWSEAKTGLSQLELAAQALKSQINLEEKVSSGEGNGNESARVAQKFIRLIDQRNQKVTQLFITQREYLSTFNIVLFGRTGAGKSSLIEAFARSNGETVSQGESDWTVDVIPRNWQSCRLYDTPGIGGWGRTMSRSNLEERAQAAVEIADIVLVCFDSQNQQAGEFEKVAAWVEHYGKPVIAVFNQRNPRWRSPMSVPTVLARRNISQAVMQHTGNIRDELAKIGLLGVPIVALSSKRALFGRATEPFQGPDASTFAKHRTQYDAEHLEAWSNFPALEALLVEGICQDAAGLRLGMLREKTCGVLQDLIEDLTNLQHEANKASGISENFIGAMLQVIGYPPKDDQFARTAFFEGSTDLLAQLEQVRGDRFQAPLKGEFHDYTDRLLSAKFGALRARSLSTAEELVITAFEQRFSLSEEDFKTRVFNQKTIQDTAQTVAKEAVSFLERKTKLLVKDAKVDFDFTIHEASNVNGEAGMGWKWAEYSAQAGKLLSSAAAALGAFAVANSWNPLGWTAGIAATVGLVGSLVSWAFGWGANRARKRAEEERQQSRGQALSQARRSVYETYDRLVQEITKKMGQISQEVVGQFLLASLKEAIALRLVYQETKTVITYLSRLIDNIPSQMSAQMLLCQAVTTVEQKQFPQNRAAGRLLWLGEDWITDPTGLRTTEIDAFEESEPTQSRQPQSFDGMCSVLTHIQNSVSVGSGKLWLSEAETLLAGDKDAFPLLQQLEAIRDQNRPRIYLCGDYSTGKTSFLKRLLINAGQPVPETLHIKADPTTSEIHEYEWGDILLIDSPGFQGGRANDTDLTLQSFPEATAILYFFQPNLVVGDTTAIDLILKGDEAQGILPKLEHTVFIINRADELGVDPTEAPDEYDRLCQRKKEELVLALQSRGIHTGTGYMLCMASDPYGLIGDQQDVHPSDFDPYCMWDGFDVFETTFQAHHQQILQSGVDVSILEGGVFRLQQLLVGVVQVINELQHKVKWNDRVSKIVQEALDESSIIETSIKASLEQLVEDHAYGLLEDTFSATDQTQSEVQAKRLSQWWEDQAFQDDLTRWQDAAKEDIEAWYLKTQETLSRRISSVEFQYAFPEIAARFNYKRKASSSRGSARKLFAASEKLKGASRDAVYEVAKFFGYKFKPYGAIKLAKNVARVGAAMAVVGLCLDVASLVQNIWADFNPDRSKQEALNFIRETKKQIYKALLEGKGTSKGPLGYLAGQQEDLGKLLENLRAECQKIEQNKFSEEAKKHRYEHLKHKAIQYQQNQRLNGVN